MIDRSQPTVETPVSAVILTHNRRETLNYVLDLLADEPLDEVIVVDSGSTDGTAESVRARTDGVRLIDAGGNVAIAGRNIGARAARNEFMLMLDDDAYPLPGAITTLVAALETNPQLAVAGGLMRDVDRAGNVHKLDGPGTFDWWLRGGRRGSAPVDGFPTFFFAEGGSLVRRSAFLEVGGFFEPYYFGTSEVDLTTRLIGAGWEVSYVPAAGFDHLKDPAGRTSGGLMRRYRVRNQIWYFLLRFPLGVALRRIPAYLLFDLIECSWHGATREWARGIIDAWRERDRVRGHRRPLPRAAIRRAEMNRGRLHMKLLVDEVVMKSRRLASRA